MGYGLILAVFLVVASSVGLAQDNKHEISLSATSASVTVDGSMFNLGTTVGYNYRVLNTLQVGGVAGAGLSTGGGTTSISWAFLVGPTLNIPLHFGFRESFFVSGGIGLVSGNVSLLGFSATAATEIAFAFTAGKRFNLVGALTLKPYIGLTKIAGKNFIFNVVPVSFSFIF